MNQTTSLIALVSVLAGCTSNTPHVTQSQQQITNQTLIQIHQDLLEINQTLKAQHQVSSSDVKS